MKTLWLALVGPVRIIVEIIRLVEVFLFYISYMKSENRFFYVEWLQELIQKVLSEHNWVTQQ